MHFRPGGIYGESGDFFLLVFWKFQSVGQKGRFKYINLSQLIFFYRLKIKIKIFHKFVHFRPGGMYGESGDFFLLVFGNSNQWARRADLNT